ncbi:MAG: lycopene cyclase domain-containing protein [Acidimicrobiales bacterium]
MDRFQYLILMGLCLIGTLPLEFMFRARVWRRPRRLLFALVPTVSVFVVWDLIAIARDHWSFSERLTSGWEILPGFPVDELLFFVAIPIVGLLTFEAVRNTLSGNFWRPWRRPSERAETQGMVP